jgi:excisionase family DNA binding protein
VTGNTRYLVGTRLLTVFQVAAIRRVLKQTAYRLARAGDLEAIKVGGSYRIPDQVLIPPAVSSSQ